MPAMEERMSYLEATVQKQGEAHARFETRVDGAFARLDNRITSLETRMDARFTQLDGRIDRIDDKLSRLFVWVVGMQMTTLIAVVGALLARG